MQITDELKDLFRVIRSMLGSPIRPVQLEDNQLCDLLEVAVGDYAAYVQNWVIESQWLNMMGNNKLITNPNELAFALSTRTLDWSRDWSQWFSKEVGLQQRGTKWELKKDFFTIEKGKQVYVVPAGREINKVLWITPSTTRTALYGAYGGGIDTGLGGGISQLPVTSMGMGVTGFYVGQSYDVALLSADLKYKNSLIRGDLAYKVTAGPNGTHLIHLMSVPGSTNTFNSTLADDSWGGIWQKYIGCVCWYTYYDVSGASDEEIEACLLENRDDVVLTPDQIPLNKMRYELMNYPTQQTIRQLLYAQACITLGMIRGYASGVVKIPEAELSLDYSMLLEEGKAEKERTLTELKERLQRMLPWELMKNQADMTEHIIKVLQYKPMPFNFLAR